MFTTPSQRAIQLHAVRRTATARLRRLAAVTAAVICGLVASATVVPAAFAMTVPPDGEAGLARTERVSAPAVHVVRVVAVGGMPGWQITVIALGAALIAATAAILLYRALVTRRPATTT